MSYKIAVIGATGNVGREMLSILAERRFPAGKVVALASKHSVGKKLSFGDEGTLKVEALESFDFTGTDIVFSSPGARVSAQFAPKAAQNGAVVIDNSSQFRMERDVPLIVPEVNPQALKGFRARNIIANPNCSTIPLTMVLCPLHRAFGVKRVVVSTYQSVSGAGRKPMDELFAQTRAIYMNAPRASKHFTKQIAFNVIPHIDVFLPSGQTREEWKMAAETAKILDPQIKISAQCVRCPVFTGHAESVAIEFDQPASVPQARDLLSKSAGITVIDQRRDGGYATPVECAGEDDVFVSRIRADKTVAHGLSLWLVADNLRKGAALNAVQIAEQLIADKLL